MNLLIKFLVLFGFIGNSYAADFNIRGESLYITGDIDEGDYEKYKETLKEHEIKKVKISSSGGVVDDAVDIGLDIFENKYDIEVFGLCASSCANYIFTAGVNKDVQYDALIIWHGSPSTFCEHSMPSIKETEENKDFLSEYRSYLEKIKNKSDDFFKTIAVDPKLTCLDKSYLKSISKYEGYTMWAISMSQFGVRNLTKYKPGKTIYKINDKYVYNFKKINFKFPKIEQ